MVELCQAPNYPAPEFTQATESFTVCLTFKEPIVRLGEEKAEPTLALTLRQKEILNILSKSPASMREIISQLEDPPSARMVQTDLNKLKKIGFILTRGKEKSSIWHLKD